ncbi:hypothetical protein CDD82_6563 [Ophiocordyceps australis]|uniref:Transcription factor domain-containing protein n=1 Tax=Ophiocordyceps australis TaxID=1399860 RepID=A0A2C5ZS33_9HYPO|nr:hypothetical protein CDD82_6563 [Ophiocordyceps australis]
MTTCRVQELTQTSAVPATDFSFSPASPTRLAHISRRPHCHLQKRPRHSQPTTEDDSIRGHHHHQAQSKGQSARKPFRATILVSPFKDCVGNFGEAHRWHFARPVDGKVNGYIKFNWPKDRDSRRPSSIYASSISDFSNIPELYASGPEADASVSLLSIGPVPASSPTLIAVPPDFDHTQFDFSSFLYGPAASGLDVVTSAASSPAADGTMEGWNEAAPLGAPRMVPKLFGYEAQMDQTDRRFWSFYIKNWCPGRSVLFETNLWLRDFAQMHKSDGVRAAIQSLAGIYIYDYQPIDSVRKRVNERFYEAESRFSHLLNDPATSQNEAQANEFITMAVILSMQDIVLTERRLQKPHEPRWLSGFRQGELFLQATDQGSRFWKRSNAQLSSLRVSQSVIVGRAMILAQPMMKLPSPDTFDPQQETTRFGWLLYGTERDVYEIHGGCGFSKKLLHIISQITYCAARLQQDPENIVVPMTTQYLHAELLQMRQWSSESKDWEVAKTCPSVIDWAMSVSEGYIITSSAEMTDVTAEAWRLTAIIYLQCRVLSVVLNLSYLARCIQIMPTSGYQFTAQAPLFPVFLLGMLATVPEHKHVSQMWFQDVVSTPVRSVSGSSIQRL